jgi:hypothetical protein
MLDFTLETSSDLLTYLGYSSEHLSYRERILTDAFKTMGGNAHPEHRKNVSKRSFIVFVNAINNVFLQWMKSGDSPEDYYLKSEQETAQVHYKYFALWEHRQKIKLSACKPVSSNLLVCGTTEVSFRPHQGKS